LAKDVIMPALGMAQETGVLLEWLKAEGDEVTKGDPLMEIETDKAAVEVEAPASGTLANVTARPGDEVPVGQVIALILAPGETAPQAPGTGAQTAEKRESEAKDEAPAAAKDNGRPLASPLATRIAADHDVDLSRVKPQGSRIQKEDVLAYLAGQTEASGASSAYRLTPASPKARRLASEQELDLSQLEGSGPQGAVLAADVQAVIQARGAAPQPARPAPAAASTTEPVAVSRMWQVMAQRLTESWTSVPHFYLTREVNASGLVKWRQQLKQRLPEKVTFTDLLVKLVAEALRRHPRLNARWEDGQIYENSDINIGLAVAVEAGLLVPVIAGADRLGLSEIAVRRGEVVSRAQAGKLSPAEMSQGTFTISNLGMYGIDAFNAIVNPPQAAILALGQIAERVVPIGGQPVVQPMMTMTLSCDHRVVDGARGAEFLRALAQFIEDPLSILD